MKHSPDIVKETPSDAKVILASTFMKSFNSMPKILRWGTIIAIIIGVFYFTVVQKYVKDYKNDTQIEIMQNTVDNMSAKLKIIEANQMNSMEIYEEVEEVQKIFNVFAEAERKKVKTFINFLRTTHGRNFDREAYENAINKFENDDFKNQKEYQDKVEEIFNERLRKRLKKLNKDQENSR